MATPKQTLKDIFKPEEKNVKEHVEQMQSTRAFSELKKRLPAVIQYAGWPLVSSGIAGKLHELMNISLEDILLGALKKHEEIMQYGDPAFYEQDETYLLALAEHTITSVHGPYLEILVGGKEIARIDFSLEVSLNIKGMLLKIQNAKILEIETGSCQGSGTLKLEDLILLEKQGETVELPGSISLGEGINIGPGSKQSSI